MKGWRLCMFMLIIGTVGCRQDEVTPDDLLYRRWLMTQIQYSTDKPIVVSPTSQWAIVTFKFNGTILYGDDGKYDPCCSPAQFKRKGTILDLVDVASIPFPERTPNGVCAMASCISPGNAWKLEELNSNRLIIRQAYGVATYQPYP